jgi:flagellar basal-body rod protein FlgF
MDPLTAAAASGLQARMDSLDLLANNLANTSTSGFKADREFYSSYFSPEATGLDPTVGDSPVVEKRWTDFAQGPLLSTGNPTDLALSGSGFFAVNGPNGPLYTRNGSFQISSQGRLVSAEGYPVRLIGGQPLQVQPGGAPLQVSADGQVAQNGVPLGQLQLVNFKTPSQLVKAVGTYFENPDPATMPPVAAANLEVAQGKIESSNAQPAESAARLVMLLRHSEMLEHAVKIGADMNRQAVEEVARIVS